MTTPNAQRNSMLPGNEGWDDLPSQPAIGNGALNGSFQALYRTRGDLDMNLNRLPTLDDVTVQPSESLVPYDSFIVSGEGTPFSGILGATSVKNGDYLVLVGADATIAANWFAINVPQPWTGGATAVEQPGFNPNATPIMNGLIVAARRAAAVPVAAKGWTKVLSQHLPFFP